MGRITPIYFGEHLGTLSLKKDDLDDFPKQIRVRWSREPFEVQNFVLSGVKFLLINISPFIFVKNLAYLSPIIEYTLGGTLK